MRGDSGFVTEEIAAVHHARAQKAVSKRYPAVLVNGHRIHVFEDGDWEVWINTEDMDFTGLCVGTGKTRDEAVAQAVAAFESITEHLQTAR